jgi:ParB family chromosome partitioning protein
MIDEDPAQPRCEFDEVALTELAGTIADRGVRQPVSVHRHPDCAGRWVLNFGARRLRACKIAGKTDIPAFIDEAADSYDQIIENEQREGLKPLELALFVQRRMAVGETQAEIARRLGKSRQYLTLATALIDAPDWLLAAYRAGRCRGMTELYELRKLHHWQPEQVEAWSSAPEPITRERLGALRSALQAGTDATSTGASAAATPATTVTVPTAQNASRGAGVDRARHRRLEVQFDGATFELVLDLVPDRAGEVFIRQVSGGTRRAVLASRLTLLGFVVD